MTPSYLLLSSDPPLEDMVISKIILRLFKNEVKCERLSPTVNRLTLLRGTKDLAAFEASFEALSADVKGNVTGLIVPTNSALFVPFLAKAKPRRVSYLFELLEEDSSLYVNFEPLIARIDPEILYTVKAYIEADRSPLLASLRLYVHRNTVAYRLTHFEKQTGLMIDSFGNERFVYALIVHDRRLTEEGYIQ